MAAQLKSEVDFSDLKPGMSRPPEDVVHTEGIIEAWDGLELFWQSWEPKTEPTGVVALMHGFGEHSARYHHVASVFVRSGYAVYAIDARGHGRSSGSRGHIDQFAQYTRDYDLAVGEAQKRWPGLHLVGFGHSNGGLICLRHALMTQGRIKAYGITSPFCGFKVKVPLPKAAAARLMTRIWPTFKEPTGLDPALLSHNEFIVKQYADDPLNLKVASARWYTETKAAQEDLAARASEIRAPFLFLVSGADEVTDARASEEVYHQLGTDDREFELLPKLRHEPLNEDGWESLATRVVDWFERHR